ncbi:MAG: transporter substrate-binding domain-containing protein, partial [Oscillospiraceae bacterium]
MKKILAMVLTLVLAVSMVACGDGKTNSTAATNDNATITKIEDIKDKKVGVQLGTTGDIYITGDIEGGLYGTATVERYNKGFEAVQALQQGKISAVIIDDQPAKAFVANNDDLTILDAPYTEEDYAFCISKDKPELTKEISDTITKLKEDGTLQSILDFYIGNVEGSKPYSSPEGIAYDGKLVMATNAEFPPYEFHSSDADGKDIITGIDADFARAICDAMGKELVIEDMA